MNGNGEDRFQEIHKWFVDGHHFGMQMMYGDSVRGRVKCSYENQFDIESYLDPMKSELEICGVSTVYACVPLRKRPLREFTEI